MGTEVSRGTREIVKTQRDQNQEENAATESKTGASVLRNVQTTMGGVPDLGQTAGKDSKESSLLGGGTRE